LFEFTAINPRQYWDIYQEHFGASQLAALAVWHSLDKILEQLGAGTEGQLDSRKKLKNPSGS